MAKKAESLAQPRPRHKRPLDRVPRKPCQLSALEVNQLMQAFTRDKCTVTEEDALTLCHWAHAQKLGAYVLELVLAGHLVPSVNAGQVCVALPGRPQEEEA